jgi:phosphomethylpyrimidine synthase
MCGPKFCAMKIHGHLEEAAKAGVAAAEAAGAPPPPCAELVR